jgi:CheY-like chemotaxis protein
MMGGDITVKSQAGKGSTFRFECLLGESEEAESTVQADARRVIGLAPGSPDFKVLVVDDKETNRLLLNRLLYGVGFKVREAADGQKCLSVFTDWEPDIVLMDMSMPVMDGYEATRRIKAMGKGSETPVIAVTASALDEARKEVAEAGADDFISKPFREAELFETLNQHLDVTYRYESQGAQPEYPPSDAGALDFSAVPEELLNALRKAVTEADMDQILDFIQETEAHSESVAARLRDLAEQFDYEGLHALMRKALIDPAG